MVAKTETLGPTGTRCIETDAKQMARRAMDDLRQSGYRALAEVSCEYHEGVLTLRGQVPSYYLKQMAQTVVRDIDAVEVVDNRLTVHSSKRR